MLETRQLTKHFGGLAAIDGLDLSINQGEVVGLIGPNGAGKTTAFNLITGFMRPTKGKIIFNGDDITGQKPHSIAKKGIARTFQATSIFNDYNVLQNIIAACHFHPEVGFLEAALHSPGSRKKETHILERALNIVKFVGLDSVKDVSPKSLPHRHKRILGIAIAMATEPKLLLLDEPLSGMRADEVGETITLISRIWQGGTTVLLIEHNVRAAMSLCQRIIVLNFGKKIAEGTPKEMMENKDVIQAYLGAHQNVA